MRTTIQWMVAVTTLLGGLPMAGIAAPRSRQVYILMLVFTGDPRGSQSDGTKRVLTGPDILTFDKQSFEIAAGQDVNIPAGLGTTRSAKIGVTIQVTPRLVGSRSVRLEILLTHTTLVERGGGRMYLKTESLKVVGTFPTWQRLQLPGLGTGRNQLWIVLSVADIEL